MCKSVLAAFMAILTIMVSGCSSMINGGFSDPIVGKWKSEKDPELGITFKSDGSAILTYTQKTIYGSIDGEWDYIGDSEDRIRLTLYPSTLAVDYDAENAFAGFFIESMLENIAKTFKQTVYKLSEDRERLYERGDSVNYLVRCKE